MHKFEIEYVWIENGGARGEKSTKFIKQSQHSKPRSIKEHQKFDVVAPNWNEAQQHADDLLIDVERRFLTESPELKRAGRKFAFDTSPRRYWSNVKASKLDGKPVNYCKRNYSDTKDRYTARIIAYS